MDVNDEKPQFQNMPAIVDVPEVSVDNLNFFLSQMQVCIKKI